MKARITHLKAPWPLGAEVGHVVLFEAGAVPAWAAGKCVPTEGDEEPAHVVPAGVPETKPEAPAETETDRLRKAFAELEAHLQAKAAQAQGEALAAALARDEALAKVAELEAQLQAAHAAVAKKK